MAYKIIMTAHAVDDLSDINDFLWEREGTIRADKVLDRIETKISDLADSPERGRYPKELLAHGIKEYREVSFKPYRVLYQVVGKNVYIVLITDGRRDMPSQLTRRLLQI